MNVYLFLNGHHDAASPFLPELLPNDWVIACDGGAKYVKELNWPLKILIGDFDSLEPKILNFYKNSKTIIKTYPIKKDATDFELALDFLVNEISENKISFKEISIWGAWGGRWDMSLSNIFLASLCKYEKLPLVFYHQNSQLRFLKGPQKIELRAPLGATLSILPFAQKVSGLTLEGLEYPLLNEDLHLGTSRGLSNNFVSDKAVISFKKGALFLILEF